MKDLITEKDTVNVARSLLGKFLVHEHQGKTAASMIIEVEAYDGPEDKASHAISGKTERTAPMFEPGGIWHVYLCYGVHWMLNLVTGPEDYPAAVLIRSTKEVVGPGRLTKHYHIDNSIEGKSALSKKTKLWIEDRGVIVDPSLVQATPRIGVEYAGEWAEKKYRFVMKGDSS